MIQDLRYACRRLRNSPGFSTVAIVTIALAVGANAAMFSLVNGMFLRPLPYPEPDRIVRILERLPSGGINAISTLNYLDWTNQSTAFEHIAAEASWRATLTGGKDPLSIRATLVSPHYFDIFGVRPAHGRMFVPGDDEPGKDRVVLLSHVFWERQFGGDLGIVGREILLNGEPHTVIGVLPNGPFDRTATQIWKPLAFQPSRMTRDYRWLGATARLKAGVTLEQARAEMELIGRRIAAAHPQTNEGWGVAVDRLGDVLFGPDMRTAVMTLFAATGFVLLIGCANLANLALARGLGRRGEMAVRAALGARRRHLVRDLLIESLVLSACGGTVAIGLGYIILRWILSWIPPYSLPPAVHIGMDTPVLLFAMIVALGAGLLFGVAPAARATTPDLVGALKGGRSGTAAAHIGGRVRGILVVAEIALAFVLLVGSGLLMRSFVNLLHIDPGFDATNVLTAGLALAPEQHRDPFQLNAYLDSLAEAVEGVPGVRAVAVTSALPLQGWGYGVPYSIAGREATDRSHRRRAFLKIVSPSYVETLGIKLLSGRGLTDVDTVGAPFVALVNETFARREFPDEDPIGRRIVAQSIIPGTAEPGPEVHWEIVGVIAGEKITGLGDPIGAGIYVSNRQNPSYALHLLVRTDVPPSSVTKAVQSAIERVDSGQALSDVRTLETIVRESTLGNRVVGTLLTVFAGLALLLAVVGIYGVVAYTAAQRAHEMGIRAALGASPMHLRRLIVQGGLRLTLIALSIGLVGAVPATELMASLLYGVSPDDPATMAVVAMLLLGIAGGACVLPAWRITKKEPIDALRSV